MRVLITGGNGMLGKDLAPAFRPQHEVLALGHSACDITNEPALRAAFSAWRPELVVNCAAFTFVDGCEHDPDGALAVNGRGPGNVASAAQTVGAQVFHISTDYVFDGRKRTPYLEDDPPNPVSRYGWSKLEGEKQILERDGVATRHLVIRTSWLYGFHRKSYVEKILTDAQSRPLLEAVADQISCPTWTVHLAQKIRQLAEMRATGIIHLAGSGQCTRYEMAQRIVEKLPHPVPVAPITWAELNLPAQRPAYSVMRSRRLEELHLQPLPHWEEALDEYLRLRQGVPVEVRGA